MVRIKIGYPTPEEESRILQRFQGDSVAPQLEAVIDAAVLTDAQRALASVTVGEEVRGYIVSIAQETRGHAGLSLGASPRAALALYKTSQALAAVDGRDFVTPDDVKHMAVPVLAHRLVLNSTSRLRGRTTEQIVSEVLSTVPVPIER
jgi:MoxR-like ATPase